MVHLINGHSASSARVHEARTTAANNEHVNNEHVWPVDVCGGEAVDVDFSSIADRARELGLTLVLHARADQARQNDRIGHGILQDDATPSPPSQATPAGELPLSAYLAAGTRITVNSDDVSLISTGTVPQQDLDYIMFGGGS